METLLQDLRYGIRMLWKNRAVTVVAIIALALGIGANSAIFTVVNAVLLRPLPFPESQRLVILSERSPQLEGMSVSYPNFVDWRDQNQVFEQLAVFRRQSVNLTGDNDPEQITGGLVSAQLFSILRVKPIIGRTFLPEEDRPGGNPVVVLSYGLWQRRFGSDANILGKTIALNGNQFTVIGIMPNQFQFPTRAELWTPVGVNAGDKYWTRDNHPGLYGIARLKPGTTIEQARAEMDTIAVRLEKQYPDSNTNNRITIESLYERVVGDFRPTLLILLAAVGAVLLIACANVANLLLARAAIRHKEIAIRTALGASRFRVIRQLLTESVILSLLGGSLGLILAMWGTDAILALSDQSTIPRFSEIHVDSAVLSFTFIISFLTGLIFGLAPALQSSKLDLNESLKDSNRGGTTGVRHQRLRSALVVSEVAIALVLLIGAGLLMKSFVRLQRVDLGFNPDHVLTMGISLPKAKYPEKNQQIQFYQQLLARASVLPGVKSAAVISELPFEGGSQTSFSIEGRPKPANGQAPLTEFEVISPDYFATMGVQLIKGRNFNEQDIEKSAKVAIIDDNFANLYWPNEDPVGKRIRGGGHGSETENPWITIIGVAHRIKYQGLDVNDQRVLTYFPYTQWSLVEMTLIVRTVPAPTSLAANVRAEVQAVDKDQPVFHIRSMEAVMSESIASQRISMLLLTLFATIALILSAVGIYGVMAYSVTQRTHEIGIRMALGAQTNDVLRMVIKQGMSLTLVGVIIGLIGATALTRTMASLLFGVSATDPTTFLAISMLLTGVALIACYIPARRATRVDPMIALRYE